MLRRFSAFALAACVAILGTAAPADAWTITWLGHAGFLVQAKSGTTVLLEPGVGNPKLPKGFELPGTPAQLKAALKGATVREATPGKAFKL
jgi:L-ascorbate metabolism protein UlaG (beta-lactamase superfamily)